MIERRSLNKSNKRFSLFLGVILYCLVWPGSTHAASISTKNNDANKLYLQGEYDQALDSYNEALSKSPHSELLNFNTAAAYYKTGDYEKARELFAKALVAQDKKLESKAAYNIGNCLFKESQLKQKDKLSQSVDYLNEALAYYQRAIELNEKDEDAKFNYELADKKLQEAKQELNKQQKQDEQKEGKQQQKEDQEAQSTQGQQQQQQQEEDQEQTSSESRESQQGQEQKDQEEAQNNQSKEDKTKGDAQQFSQEAREMNEEEAKMLINAYAHEGLRLDLFDRQSLKNEPDVEKDW